MKLFLLISYLENCYKLFLGGIMQERNLKVIEGLLFCSFYFVMGLIFIGRKWKGKAENTLFMAISSSTHGGVS